MFESILTIFIGKLNKSTGHKFCKLKKLNLREEQQDVKACKI